MPEIIPWSGADAAEATARAVEDLQAGRLVAFPTEGVYEVAACGLFPEAVARLRQLACPQEPLTLGLASPHEVLDWLPGLSGVGKRLAQRGWPGCFTLLAQAGRDCGLARRLPADSRAHLGRGDDLALRVVDHEAVRKAAHLLAGPLVLASVDGAVRPEDVLKKVGAAVDTLVDAGACRLGKTSTLVRLDGRSWRIDREGALSMPEVEQLALCQILFVCTGNTCRSPMAQALCAKMLAERLGCTPGELPRRGYLVVSAGLAAFPGEEASPEAVAAVAECGGDLAGHRSQPLNLELVLDSDFLFAMTGGHLRFLDGLGEAGGPRPRLLSIGGADVADPIGADQETYRACARQILDCLEERLPEILEAGASPL